MNRKADSVIRIPSSLDTDFFKYWLVFLSPFHNLTNRELDIATGFLKHRYELSKVISDNDILDKVTLGEETRIKITKECGISTSFLQVIIGKLKKSGFITNGKINPRFIPNIKEDSGNYQLLLLFEL